MSDQGARIYDVGYRSYDGPRSAPIWALATIWRHTLQRVLGLHRSFRHKVLPGIALVIAFVPALIFVGIAAFLPVEPGHDEILPSYGEYASLITLALALFASMVAPEALCTDRRTGMLDLYLAGPLDVTRYLAAKWATVAERDARDDRRPAALPAARPYGIENKGPSAPGTPLLLLQILVAGIGVALFYTAVAMARLEPDDAARGRGRGDRPAPARALDRGRRRDREQRRPGRARASRSARGRARVRLAGLRRHPRNGLRRHPPIADVSTGLVVAGLVGWIVLGAACVLGQLPPAGEAAMSATAPRRGADRGPRRLEVVRERRRRLRRQLRHRPRDHGAARPERRRQVDDAPDALRAGQAVEGNGAAARQRSPLQHRRHPPARPRPAAGGRVRAPHRARVRAPVGHAARPSPIPTAPPGQRSRPSSSTPTTSGGCRPTRRACASGSSSRRRSSTTRG